MHNINDKSRKEIKHCYISAKEPYISAKEPYISAKEPYISQKRCMISSHRYMTSWRSWTRLYRISAKPFAWMPPMPFTATIGE